jgi:hypothetical protein
VQCVVVRAIAFRRAYLSLGCMDRAARGRFHLYLADHIAAAVGGLALCRRAARGEKHSEFGPALSALTEEIERDLERLREIAQSVGAQPRAPVKEGLARLAERLGRLKVNDSLLSRSRLSRVYELEVLAAAIRGKRSLWETLLEIAPSDAPLASADLQELLVRADGQEEEIRRLHAAATAEAFGGHAEELVRAPA